MFFVNVLQPIKRVCNTPGGKQQMYNLLPLFDIGKVTLRVLLANISLFKLLSFLWVFKL